MVFRLAFYSFFALGLIQNFQAQTPTYAYDNAFLRWSEVVYHIEGGIVRRGNNWRGEILYAVQQNRIYVVYSSSSFDIAYTLRDNQLFLGDSHFTDAIAYTLERNHIYVGDSRFPLDLAYTISPDPHRPDVINIYKDSSISPLDIVAYLQGDPTATEIFALLFAMGLL